MFQIRLGRRMFVGKLERLRHRNPEGQIETQFTVRMGRIQVSGPTRQEAMSRALERAAWIIKRLA